MQLTVILVTFIELVKFSAEKSTCGREVYSIYSSEDDAFCYWTKESDDLPLLDENTLVEESIYFIEASCKGGLNVREACSVEAAAKVNPTREVNVLFTGPVIRRCYESEPLSCLQKYENIHLSRIYVDEYVKNTSFSKELHKTVINKGSYPNLYTLDLLKIITLFKFDGIYMDLDMMATKAFDNLPKPKNWVGIEDHATRSLSTAIFAASSDAVGRKLINSIMRALHNGIASNEWDFKNFNVLRSAVELFHERIPFEKTEIGHSFSKNGLVLYARHFFFPIQCQYSAEYFDSKLDIDNITKSFTQQLCNGMTFQDPVTENSTYAELMSEFCPNVFEYFSNLNFKEDINLITM